MPATCASAPTYTVAYFDQMREQLDENATLADVISPGSEWVEIGSERKHVLSYLGDFLFPPARAGSPVRSLSGGERARLLLARLFARPANVLVLDEPTNDLGHRDARVAGIPAAGLRRHRAAGEPRPRLPQQRGHANHRQRRRRRLARLRGRLRRMAGPAPRAGGRPAERRSQDRYPARRAAAPRRTRPRAPSLRARQRLSSWEERELNELPDALAGIEARQTALSDKLADGRLYHEAPEEAARVNDELAQLEKELEEKFACWELLEAKRAAS